MPSTEPVSPAEKSDNIFSGLDGESRNRLATQTLLKLRGESLMKAVAEGSKTLGTRLDYGNASAWMREIPGRFGKKKQEELLRYLGIENHRLNSSLTHFWALPLPSDDEQSRALRDLLVVYADPPNQYKWLSTTSGALRGLAILAGGVSIVFQPNAETNQADMTKWLDLFGLKGDQDVTTEADGKTDYTWQQLVKNQLTPEALWVASSSLIEREWQNVIDWAKQEGLSPEETQKLLREALLKSRMNPFGFFHDYY